MSGWIFWHNNKKLAQGKFWGYENDGWIWTDSEKDDILEHCFSWKFKPTHIQRAVLLAGKVSLIGEKIEVK